MDDFLEDPKAMNDEMRIGLARMFADQGYRAYLLNKIRLENTNGLKLLEANEVDKAKRAAIRMKAFSDLLDKGEECFTKLEELRKKHEKK